MDLRSFFGASTSSSNCSDSDSDIAESPSKKACGELIQPLITEEKILKQLEKRVQLASV